MMVGIDVTHIERIRSLMTRYPDAETRFFTARERLHCRSHTDPMVHFAGTFAAKEAVIKTLRLGRAVAWARRIEIVRDETGAPTARVLDAGFSDGIMLSISHDENVAIAVAVSPRSDTTAPWRSSLTVFGEACCGSDFP